MEIQTAHNLLLYLISATYINLPTVNTIKRNIFQVKLNEL